MRRAALLALLPVLLPAPAPSPAAEADRVAYVTHLEQICRPGSDATQEAVRGVRHLVQSERLPEAAPKVVRAKRIFDRTVGAISKVARPEQDRATLARWFRALGREAAALQRTVSALRADDVARFERVWADFIHEGNKANNVVVSFGFNFCAFRSSRYM